MNTLRGIGVLSAVAALSVGCQSKLYDENLELHRQNRELQEAKDADDVKLRQMADPQTVAAMQSQLADREKGINDRDAKINELETQLKTQPANAPADPNLAGIETSYNAAAGTLTVNIPGDVLFASGQAEVKASADATLNKIIAAIKKDYAGKKVLVDGYTDQDPITKTKEQWEDNLDLSAGRARSVAAYLTQHGLSATLVFPRAMGATALKTSKVKSRRVEIVVSTR